tara:strand:+ start:1219 stop:1458 length:240 start_codon:yes stop_codon:yes gene_type:complete
MTDAAPNDLTELSIAELMDSDPLHLTTRDKDRLILYFRESRKKFVLGNMTAGKPEAKKTVASKKNLELAKDVDLGELGL